MVSLLVSKLNKFSEQDTNIEIAHLSSVNTYIGWEKIGNYTKCNEDGAYILESHSETNHSHKYQDDKALSFLFFFLVTSVGINLHCKWSNLKIEFKIRK